MAFLQPQDIYETIEGLLSELWEKVLNIKIKTPFMHMKYEEAIGRLQSTNFQ